MWRCSTPHSGIPFVKYTYSKPWWILLIITLHISLIDIVLMKNS
jgi:hypothetical protein